MTLTSATSTPGSASALLAERLEALRVEREQVLAESRLEAVGDVADRATNVEATIRLQLLDERIATIELEIEQAGRQQHTDGVVSVGDVVTLDLGDGPETYVVGSVEQASAGVDTVTPASPLGRAILGAEVGTTVTYSPRSGVKLSAVIVSAETA
ncbi:GreA/GreB family elongation factor [Nocardioides lianchengensis]|uniref:Transcription elongation factor GreA n=1 Tax=Nocardioides lianchengensis TaxID=1045774 RepID=A0A1G7B897_9ACTN|nr:GreA/GreB family elongation factor [Nocardioides lianchengensis]NYG10071.1 transcription elongation factor GreA [Nocardioides lianchengensis]SDE23334.1 transcription elongation factor GreA [Nocardioides lianchengensis]